MDQDSYQPEPGDWTLVTLHARCLGDGIGGTLVYRVDGVSGEALTISSGEDAFVRVEPSPQPALPTAFGSRIEATVRSEMDDLVTVELVLGNPGGATTRWMRVTGEWFEDDELSNVRLLHDAAAQMAAIEPASPVDLGPDYVQCDECESTGRNCRAHPSKPKPLPTKIGAVVVATWGGQRIVAVLARPDSRFSWTSDRKGEGSMSWLTPEDFTDVDVLAPGVEVELP